MLRDGQQLALKALEALDDGRNFRLQKFVRLLEAIHHLLEHLLQLALVKRDKGT